MGFESKALTVLVPDGGGCCVAIEDLELEPCHVKKIFFVIEFRRIRITALAV